MKAKLLYLATTFLLIQSCERYSRGIIINESSDTIQIKLTANNVKVSKIPSATKLFPSEYFKYFKDSLMIDPHTYWQKPVFKGDFKLAPETLLEFSLTKGEFSLQSIHFDTMIIITQYDTMLYKSKKEIFKAFETTDNAWYYMIISDSIK